MPKPGRPPKAALYARVFSPDARGVLHLDAGAQLERLRGVAESMRAGVIGEYVDDDSIEPGTPQLARVVRDLYKSGSLIVHDTYRLGGTRAAACWAEVLRPRGIRLVYAMHEPEPDAEAIKTIRAFHEVRAMAAMDRRPGTAAVNAELRERAAEVVERLRADGLSYAKCARALNEQGIKPLAGPDWTAEGVRNLVRVR